ncbi:uncharacterized protein LOC129583190 [Paramacrobiotus metropolitanus]|uniref:uncharacterized protein LOC129583190 n=1 Tax=Paramacrobiotus metropolitanus TaxID=2943436 RepID=UPI002445E788|nr:uncharacterized protein LOC129583190 [Paramacrobiotus metropolitanus]
MAETSEHSDSQGHEEVETYGDPAEDEELEEDDGGFDDPRRGSKQTIEQETLSKLAIVAEVNPYQAPEKTPESKELWQKAIDRCVEQGIYVNMNSKKPPRSMLQQLVNRYVTEFRQKYPGPRLTVEQEAKLNEREKYARLLVSQMRKRPKRWFDKASNMHVVVAGHSGEKRQKLNTGAGAVGNLVRVEHLHYPAAKDTQMVVNVENDEHFEPLFTYGNEVVAGSLSGLSPVKAEAPEARPRVSQSGKEECSAKCNCQQELRHAIGALVKCMQDNMEMMRTQITVDKETRERELQMRREEAEKDREMQLTLARQAQESQSSQLKLILEAALKLATGKASGV